MSASRIDNLTLFVVGHWGRVKTTSGRFQTGDRLVVAKDRRQARRILIEEFTEPEVRRRFPKILPAEGRFELTDGDKSQVFDLEDAMQMLCGREPYLVPQG
jgi:hypothetical protein